MAGKKLKRVRSEMMLYPIANWNEADDHLKRIGDLRMAIESEEQIAKSMIDNAKAILQEATEPLAAEIKRHIESLEAFAANHIEDFGKAKSRKLQFGVVGWRASRSLKVCKDIIDRIKGVFGKKAETYLRIKEDADKEALGKLTDEQLVAVGCRWENKDVFFAEPDCPEAVDY
jgi:phage host-nuclease inhibitor protein Gam